MKYTEKILSSYVNMPVVVEGQFVDGFRKYGHYKVEGTMVLENGTGYGVHTTTHDGLERFFPLTPRGIQRIDLITKEDE